MLQIATVTGAELVLLGVRAVTPIGGKFSFVADVQQRLNELPSQCRVGPGIVADGKFGKFTRLAIQVAAGCPEIRSQLNSNSAAHSGALTDTFWKALFPNRAIPDLHQRAMVVVLTHEATDYDTVEWNFCQNNPTFDPPIQPSCFSNDPKSFLTWGPRGATAGHGAELQYIIEAIDSNSAARSQVDRAFKGDAPSVRRLLKLDEADTELFLCSIWLNPVTRRSWQQGFREFGSNSLVRNAYDIVYSSAEFDGGKMERYYHLYSELGLVPSEVDYAFFLDRATQMGAPTDAVAKQARVLLQGKSGAEVRRWLAQNFRPTSRKTDRLGRDVVFYIDAFENVLSHEERVAWLKRNPSRASEYGLRDNVDAASFELTTTQFQRLARDPAAALTPKERAICPSAVLAPRLP